MYVYQIFTLVVYFEYYDSVNYTSLILKKKMKWQKKKTFYVSLPMILDSSLNITNNSVSSSDGSMLTCQIKKFDISMDLSDKNDEFIHSINTL